MIKGKNIFKEIFNNFLANKIRYTAEDILTSKEKRVALQQQLKQDWGHTLVCCRVNYPGIRKCNIYSVSILNILGKKILDNFQEEIIYKRTQITAEGPVLILVINKNSLNVKEYAVKLEENHPLGRFIDFDVYGNDSIGISRSKLGLNQRECYLCSEYAQICIRSRKHKQHDVEIFIKKSFIAFVQNQKSMWREKA